MPMVLELRLMDESAARQVEQPDGMLIPKDSVWIFALDADGKVSARLGLVPIPIVSGFFADDGLDASQVLAEMQNRLENFLAEYLNCRQTFTVLSGVQPAGWTDTGLKLYRKELGGG